MRPLGADLSSYARDLQTQLKEKVLPYWYDTAVDWQRGGYLLSDDGSGHPPAATEKQLVTQARMVWGFSLAHENGYSDRHRDYLKAARNGYRFLVTHFRDPQEGGYYWKTDLSGQPVNDRKYLYGEGFVIYSLVEYYRASHDREARRRALELYRTIQAHCHDPAHGGWIEHCQRDWTPITQQDDRIEVELAGLRSANAHLHWMEALTELEDATHDAGVRASLAEALRLNATYFYPANPAQCSFHRHPDWTLVTGPRSAGLSYGHNVEFAWLMLRAEQVLRLQLSWTHFYALLDHALAYGYDHTRGGLFSRGADDTPATDTDKVWWVQAEMLAALTVALQHQPNPAYTTALEQLLGFLGTYQVHPPDGIWYDTVAADGHPKRPDLAHNWKANYHDVRAMLKFIDAYANPRPAR